MSGLTEPGRRILVTGFAESASTSLSGYRAQPRFKMMAVYGGRFLSFRCLLGPFASIRHAARVTRAHERFSWNRYGSVRVGFVYWDAPDDGTFYAVRRRCD